MTNTHIIGLRNESPEFRNWTNQCDFMIPDSAPLAWAVNLVARRVLMKKQVYGPELLRKTWEQSPTNIKHGFLGGDQTCQNALKEKLRLRNPEANPSYWRNGYFPHNELPKIAEEIKKKEVNILWIGTGTPKQQEHGANLKNLLKGYGIKIIHIGFGFDATSGIKRDAPVWMRQSGLAWLWRLANEPRRLGKRYLKYNLKFLWLLGKELTHS